MAWLIGTLSAILLAYVACSFLVKGFWGSLWADVKGYFNKHFLMVIGAVIQFVAPLALLAVAYCSVKETNKVAIAFPIAVWVIAIPLIIAYFFKLRKAIKLKHAQMKAVNEVKDGAHKGSIPTLRLLDALFTVGAGMIVWMVVNWIEQIMKSASSGIMLIVVCTAIGFIFYIMDDCFSSTK